MYDKLGLGLTKRMEHSSCSQIFSYHNYCYMIAYFPGLVQALRSFLAWYRHFANSFSIVYCHSLLYGINFIHQTMKFILMLVNTCLIYMACSHWKVKIPSQWSRNYLQFRSTQSFQWSLCCSIFRFLCSVLQIIACSYFVIVMSVLRSMVLITPLVSLSSYFSDSCCLILLEY